MDDSKLNQVSVLTHLAEALVLFGSKPANSGPLSDITTSGMP